MRDVGHQHNRRWFAPILEESWDDREIVTIANGCQPKPDGCKEDDSASLRARSPFADTATGRR